MSTYAIFSANYLPNLGGVERYTYNLAKKLKERGHSVIVVTSNVFGLNEQEETGGIKICRLPCFNLLNGRFPVICPDRKFFEIKKALLSEKIDYVVVNTRFYIHSLFGASIARAASRPLLVIEHGTGHLSIGNKAWDFLGHIYEHFVTSLLKRYKPLFCGVSEACRAWLSHFNVVSLGVLYNAVDLDEINGIRARPAANYRDDFGLSSDDVSIVYAGRLVSGKGILNLIEAFLRCLNRGEEIYLFVAGDGELYSKVRQFESKNIIVLGKIDFPQVISLLSQSDIFCLPTEYPEGFPTSILEAAACGCYCITTSFGGSKEFINDDTLGTIMSDGSPESVEAALLEALYDASARKASAARAYERLREFFTWDRTADALIEIFGNSKRLCR